jgi:thioredoxin 1
MHVRKSLIVPFLMVAGLSLAMALGLPGLAAVRDIYPAPEQAKTDLAAALQSAAASHRRVIVDFGGNWCPDCHVLDGYFHDAANSPILDAHYVLVHINIGRMDQNLDIAEHYQIPLRKGVPALVVLDTDGKILYSQKTGEFEDMRHMQSGAVTEFLERWNPPAAP